MILEYANSSHAQKAVDIYNGKETNIVNQTDMLEVIALTLILGTILSQDVCSA